MPGAVKKRDLHAAKVTPARGRSFVVNRARRQLHQIAPPVVFTALARKQFFQTLSHVQIEECIPSSIYSKFRTSPRPRSSGRTIPKWNIGDLQKVGCT